MTIAVNILSSRGKSLEYNIVTPSVHSLMALFYLEHSFCFQRLGNDKIQVHRDETEALFFRRQTFLIYY